MKACRAPQSLSRLSIRFIAGPAGWLEDLEPGAPGYNSHSVGLDLELIWS